MRYPVCYSPNQGFGYIRVINEVYVAESYIAGFPDGICSRIDNADNSACNFAVFVSKEDFVRAKLQCRVLGRIEHVFNILFELWYILWAIFVKGIWKFDEYVECFVVCDLFYLYHWVFCWLLKLVAGTYQTALWYSNASNAAAKRNESQGLTLTKCSYIQK